MACDEGMHDVMPSYFELICGILKFTVRTIRENYLNGRSFPSEEHAWQYLNFAAGDVVLVVFLGAAFTVLRHFATELVFKPLAKHYRLTSANQKKMPESAWKFCYYLCAWSFSFYVVILSGRYCFFQRPSVFFEGWSLTEMPPLDICLMYAIQGGFYTHSLYSTLFLDTWRKDSIVMMAHHILTLALISISYSLRYHNIGAVVLLLHDVCDIQLEFTKLNVYFKIQDGRLVKKHEVLANGTFFCFALTWFVTRLYLYPLKVLYSTTSVVSEKNLVLPCAILMNSLLWTLQAMNIYWFLLIVGLLLRVVTGQMRDFDDTREYDVEEKFSQKLSAELESVSGTSTPNSFTEEPKNGISEKRMLSNGESTNALRSRKINVQTWAL